MAHEPGSSLTAVYVSALLPLVALSVVTTPYPRQPTPDSGEGNWQQRGQGAFGMQIQFQNA